MKGNPLRIPTAKESLRVKGFVAVQRNQMRDYLDIAALSDYLGADRAADTLSRIGDYYSPDLTLQPAVGVEDQVAGRLAKPQPKDARVLRDLMHYKGLDRAYTDWGYVVATCQDVAEKMEPTDV